MSAVEISVLISNFNYARYIGQALDSVLNQSTPPHEIIVYDDGSTDGSREIIRRYPVHLNTGRNKGVAHARNRMVQLATGTHLLFLDGDDWLAPRAIEKAVRFIQTTDSINAVYWNYRFHCESDAVQMPLIRRRTPSVLSLDTCYKVLHYTPCHTMLFPAAWAVPFDPALSTSEDQAFWAELLLTGKRFHHIPEPLSVYRLHGASRSSGRRLKSLENQVAIHKKLLTMYPDATRSPSFMKHVRWRRYKLALELYRQDKKIMAARALLSSLGPRDASTPFRLAILAMGTVFPGKWLRWLTGIAEKKHFPVHQD